MFTSPFEVSGWIIKDISHTTGETLIFLLWSKMTEIIHGMCGKKLKYIPLSSNAFEICRVNIADLKTPVSKQLHTVEDLL